MGFGLVVADDFDCSLTSKILSETDLSQISVSRTKIRVNLVSLVILYSPKIKRYLILEKANFPQNGSSGLPRCKYLTV